MTFFKQFAGAPGEIEQISVLSGLGRRVPDGGSGGEDVSARGADAVIMEPAATTDRRKARRLVASGKAGLAARSVALGIVDTPDMLLLKPYDFDID